MVCDHSQREARGEAPDHSRIRRLFRLARLRSRHIYSRASITIDSGKFSPCELLCNEHEFAIEWAWTRLRLPVANPIRISCDEKNPSLYGQASNIAAMSDGQGVMPFEATFAINAGEAYPIRTILFHTNYLGLFDI